MDADSIWLTILSIIAGPIMGLLVALVVSSRALRGVLAQAEQAASIETAKAKAEAAVGVKTAQAEASAEAQRSRQEIIASYSGVIATLRAETERLGVTVVECRKEIEALKAQMNMAGVRSQILLEANAVLTLKVASLEAEAKVLKAQYDDLEDRYVMALGRRGASGMGQDEKA